MQESVGMAICMVSQHFPMITANKSRASLSREIAASSVFIRRSGLRDYSTQSCKRAIPKAEVTRQLPNQSKQGEKTAAFVARNARQHIYDCKPRKSSALLQQMRGIGTSHRRSGVMHAGVQQSRSTALTVYFSHYVAVHQASFASFMHARSALEA